MTALSATAIGAHRAGARGCKRTSGDVKSIRVLATAEPRNLLSCYDRLPRGLQKTCDPPVPKKRVDGDHQREIITSPLHAVAAMGREG
jgi:hypothetical protein